MRRLGGHLVAESLVAAGARAAFGVPGIHALSIWDGLRDLRELRTVPLRTELAAGFAADGYARAGGGTGVLLTTTGPGAFVATCALMEARSAYVPLVNVVSQIPAALIDRGRGYLHELVGQSDVLRPFAKWHAVASDAAEIPLLLAEAFRAAASAPQGPAVLELPVDVLEAETALAAPGELDVAPVAPRPPASTLLDEAAALLREARLPVLWAGGGVLRSSGAPAALRALAELLDAPVATTYMGKGALPGDHPLAVGSGCDEGAFQELLRTADVVLAVGTELGAETTGQWALRFEGRLVQVDVRAEHLGLSYPGLGIEGDAAAVLVGLCERVGGDAERNGAERAAAVRRRIADGFAAQGLEPELALLAALRSALPRDGVLACDMTIAGYLAAPLLDVYEPGTFLYPLGSGTLGYAWPAAIGASVARPRAPVLAVHGDGGVLYSVLELLSARQAGLDPALLVIDDGGYGILRVYQEASYGRSTAVDLARPDFAMLARACGAHAHVAEPGGLAPALAHALAERGPSLVYLRETLRYPQPTP
jgi:acetolactate synthase-1/2/3 large subunit